MNWLQLYATMARIRAFELAAEVASQGGVQVLGAKLNDSAKVRGPLHLSIGQELNFLNMLFILMFLVLYYLDLSIHYLNYLH